MRPNPRISCEFLHLTTHLTLYRRWRVRLGGLVQAASASVPWMADDSSGDGLRTRLQRSSEDALGRLAQDLLENPIVNGALTRAFEAREKAAQAQEAAMGALNLPSAADIERLTRRVRSVSQRLEGTEDGAARADERLAALTTTALDARLKAIERRLEALGDELRAIAQADGATRRARKPAARKPARTAGTKPRAGRTTRSAPPTTTPDALADLAPAAPTDAALDAVAD